MQQENQILSYTSDSFDPASSREYQLVIDGTLAAEPVLAFFDGSGQLMYLNPYSGYQNEWPDQTLQNLDLLSVRFTVPQIGATIIPDELYDPSYTAVYQHYVQDDGLSPIQTAHVEALGVRILYREYLPVLDPLIRMFPDAARSAFSDLWLGWLGRYLSQSEETVLALHFGGEDVLYSAVFHQDKLFHHAVFPLHTEEHLSYFLMKIAAETGLELRGTAVLVSGNINEGDLHHTSISKYGSMLQFPDEHHLLSVLLAKI